MKKLNVILNVLTIFTLFCANVALAGNEDRAGTAGAVQVMLPVSAKNLGLSNAFSADLKGVDGLALNPASIGVLPKSEVYFTNMRWLADINLYYLGAGVNMGDVGNFALTITSIDFGDIQRTTTGNPYGSGETFSPTNIMVGLSYGRELTEYIQFGSTVKIIHESILSTSATGLALDVGFQYSGSGVVPGLNFGIAIKNIGLTKMVFEGQDLANFNSRPIGSLPDADTKPSRTPSEPFDIPSSFEFGLAYKFYIGDLLTLNMGSNYINNNLSYDALNVGAEFAYQNMLFFRGGYSQTASANETPFGPTFGVGLNYNIGFEFGFDYAYRSVDILTGSENQLFSIKIGL